MGCTVLLAGPDPPPPRLGPCRTVWVPLYRAEPVPGSSVLARGVLGLVEAVLFTSPRAPRLLARDALERGVLEDLVGLLRGVDRWAIGDSTARAIVESFGLDARVSGCKTGVCLAREVAGAGYRFVAGMRSPTALRRLAEVLADSGVAYVEVHVYRLVEVEGAREAIRETSADVVVATSPMIARGIVSAGFRGLYVAIGPTTAAELARLGVEPACVARVPRLEAVGECLYRVLAGGS